VVKIVEALFINQKLLVHCFKKAHTFALVYMAFFIAFRDGNPARCKTSTSTNYLNMSIYNSLVLNKLTLVAARNMLHNNKELKF
jgi:hypothetical protein